MSGPENKAGNLESENEEGWTFWLFVVGPTPNSTLAIRNIKEILEEFLSDQYKLEIIDILESPHQALEKKVLAAPTLIKASPPPEVRIVGNMNERDKVLWQLGLADKRK